MYKASIPSTEYKRLFAAICYHDIYHTALEENNKEECFNIFKRDWNKAISEDDLNSVYPYITATRFDINTDDIQGIKHADLIHDLNKIEFIDYETMKNSDIRLKSEYTELTPKAFYELRLKYFKQLLKTGVFISSKYKKYNNIASENIKQYITEIKTLLSDLTNI
jgi:hypothetical protein